MKHTTAKQLSWKKTNVVQQTAFGIEHTSRLSQWLFVAKVLLLSLWIFAAPTNLFYKIMPNLGFVGGLQIDYLIPKFYLVDIVSLLMIEVWGLEKMRQYVVSQLPPTRVTRWSLVLAITTVLFLVRQFFTPFPISAVWFFVTSFIHLTAFFIGLSWIKSQRMLSLKKAFVAVLAGTLLFQSALGLYQFVEQRQFVGFAFFGEPQLTRDIGLSKGDFAPVDEMVVTHLGLRILPYGTTPHPNVLAGFLAIGILVLVVFFLTDSSDSLMKGFIGFSIVLTIVTLLLTLSISAWLTLGLGMMWMILRKKKMSRWIIALGVLTALIGIPIGIHGFNLSTHQKSTSLFRRDVLNQQALKFFSQNPILGTGINQFTVGVAQSSQNQSETVAFVQPAHHLPLLFLTENGLLGIVWLALFCKQFGQKLSASKVVMLLILPIISLDHYFYSLTVGQSIFAIALWIFSIL